MACTDAGAIVAMKVFVEKKQVAPVRIRLKFLCTAVHCTASILVALIDSCHPVDNLLAHFKQVHLHSRAGGALYLELIAVVVMKLLQRLDQQKVHRKPDGTAPVRVAAFQFVNRLGGLVTDGTAIEQERFPRVRLREAADAVVGKELAGIPDALDDPRTYVR